MSDLIRSFEELSTEQQPQAGGKGGSLARLYQAGYPVPDGFTILPGRQGAVVVGVFVDGDDQLLRHTSRLAEKSLQQPAHAGIDSRPPEGAE
ncbi:hypothetical protein ACFLYD_06685, partial [Chloroflexota bacterium]